MLSFEVHFTYYRVVEQTNKGVLNGLKGFPLPISISFNNFWFFYYFSQNIEALQNSCRCLIRFNVLRLYFSIPFQA